MFHEVNWFNDLGLKSEMLREVMNALQTINTLHFKSVGNVERSQEARLNAKFGACNEAA